MDWIGNNMSKVSASLTKWISERPQWLQIAATRLLQESELTDKDVSELAILCQQEADGKLPNTTCSFPATAFSQGASGTLRLCSISDVEGVNALAPKKPLEFGKGNITIVYGNNGSGKSGYVDSSSMYVVPARRVPFTAMSISPPLPYRKPAFYLSRMARRRAIRGQDKGSAMTSAALISLTPHLARSLSAVKMR